MTVLDNVPVGRITAQAREVHFWRTVLTIIAGLLFGVGWLAYKTVAVTWLAGAWSAVAVREGWLEARKGQRAAGHTG
jgi:hypothetical protein